MKKVLYFFNINHTAMISMLGFLGTFSVNFDIPDYWGIGKSVSRGFGTIRGCRCQLSVSGKAKNSVGVGDGLTRKTDTDHGVYMKSVEDLDVFKLAHEVTLEIYRVTKGFPEQEKYGLVSQIRKASMSVPMNLMEGSHRLNRKEYRQFVSIAKGSAGELKYQLMLSRDLNYIPEENYRALRAKAESISKMLTKLAASLTDTDNRH